WRPESTDGGMRDQQQSARDEEPPGIWTGRRRNRAAKSHESDAAELKPHPHLRSPVDDQPAGQHEQGLPMEDAVEEDLCRFEREDPCTDECGSSASEVVYRRQHEHDAEQRDTELGDAQRRVREGAELGTDSDNE